MPADPRGRWFRVYARQIRQHPKFHDLSLTELGAWLVLRAEAELRDEAIIADRAEALLILKRRHGTAPMLNRLLSLKLFEVDDDGSLFVHDRADHDSSRFPSDDPAAVRERQRKSRIRHDSSIRDAKTPSRPQAEQATEPATEAEQATEPFGLPLENDAATLACRMLPNGGEWLGRRDYVKAWDDLERLYGEWVPDAIALAYQSLLSQKGKVLGWDLKRAAETIMAERSRADELNATRQRTKAEREELEAIQARQQELAPEVREQQELQRRAVRLWMEGGMQGEVPTDPMMLKDWVAQYEQGAA